MDREPLIQSALRPLSDLGSDVIPAKTHDCGDGHQVITETSHRQQIRDEVCGDKKISECCQQGEPCLRRRCRIKHHFQRFKGFKAKVETRFLVEGRRRFSGTLGGVEGDKVLMITEEGDALLTFSDMAKAKLIATDELFEAAKAGTLPRPVTLAEPKTTDETTSDSMAGSTPES